VITDTVAFALAFISIYVPAAGGINCDGDCSVMASGLPPFIGAAACDPELMRWEFCLDWAPAGMPLCYQCLDTGGRIRGPYIDLCYVPRQGELVSEALVFARAWGSRRVPVTFHGWQRGARLEFCAGDQCLDEDASESAPLRLLQRRPVHNPHRGYRDYIVCVDEICLRE